MTSTTPRPVPCAWIVRSHGTQDAVFVDYGRALGYAARTGGQLVNLYDESALATVGAWMLGTGAGAASVHTKENP